MIIVAKFASVCPCCSIRIAVGSKVEWSRGEKAKHAACAGKPAAAAAAAPKSPGIVYYGSRQRYGSGHGSAANVAGYSSYCTANGSCRCYDCAS